MGNAALPGVHSRPKTGVLPAGPLNSFVGQFEQIGEGGVRQREGGSVRHGRGHVRDAVMKHVVDEIDGIGVGGGARSLETTTLIDRDVHGDRAAFHARDHVATHELGRGRSRNEHSATTRSECFRVSEMVHALEARVTTRPLKISSSSRSRLRLRSMIVTWAPMPMATLAALVPTTPPPRMATFAGATPGTPPSRMPRPPLGRSRYCAPTCTARRPATSLMGVRSGSDPSGSTIVSYAMPVTPAWSNRSVNSGKGAR